VSTPSGVTIHAHRKDGLDVDITEGVQALYDTVIQSLDWGSGFLTIEDALPIARVAEVCGFEQAEEAQRYLQYRRFEELREKLISEGMKYRDASDIAKRAFPWGTPDRGEE
jgi:hypothetical protein